MDLDDDDNDGKDAEYQEDNNSNVGEVQNTSNALFLYQNAPEDRREHNSPPYVNVKTSSVHAQFEFRICAVKPS